MDKLFEKSANLTTRKVALVWYWENKFFSLGSFVTLYSGVLKFSKADERRILFGESLAQFDAVLLAWKEKVRHDLVRPTTMIRKLLKGKTVQAYKGLGKGVGSVKAEEWEPVVPIQPHSEYPSASAAICTASMEHWRASLKEFVGNGTIPAYDAVFPPGIIPRSPIDIPIRYRFETPEIAAQSCGHSRLLGGVHFAPSVPAGFELAKGLGKRAFEQVSTLYAGKIPKTCTRCVRT